MDSLSYLFHCSISLSRISFKTLHKICPVEESLSVDLEICILEIFQVIFMPI